MNSINTGPPRESPAVLLVTQASEAGFIVETKLGELTLTRKVFMNHGEPSINLEILKDVGGTILETLPLSSSERVIKRATRLVAGEEREYTLVQAAMTGVDPVLLDEIEEVAKPERERILVLEGFDFRLEDAVSKDIGVIVLQGECNDLRKREQMITDRLETLKAKLRIEAQLSFQAEQFWLAV